MKPTFICFDATGTLIETAEKVGEVYRRVALEHGVDLPAWRLDDSFRRVMRSAPPRGVEGESPVERRRAEVEWWSERIRQTFQATDSTARFDDFSAFAKALFDRYRSAAVWRIRPGIRDTLAHLHARGVRMGVVSNFDHRLLEILQALDINDFFDFVEIPSDRGSAKPDRAVFERAASTFEAPLEALLYVGDDPPEVLDAIARLGLQVLDVRGTHDAESLADLLERTANLPRRA